MIPKIKEFAVPTIAIESNNVSPTIVLTPAERLPLITAAQQVALLNEAVLTQKQTFGEMGLKDAV